MEATLSLYPARLTVQCAGLLELHNTKVELVPLVVIYKKLSSQQ